MKKWTEYQVPCVGQSKTDPVQNNKYFIFLLVLNVKLLRRHECRKQTIWEEEKSEQDRRVKQG